MGYIYSGGDPNGSYGLSAFNQSYNGAQTLPAFNPSGMATPAAQSGASTPAAPSVWNPWNQSPGSMYRQDLGPGWNPTQYATNDYTNKLAGWLGARPTQTTGSTAGPFSVPDQNVLDYGDGFVSNAGLTGELFQNYDPAQAMRMLADQRKIAQGGTTTTGTDPGLVHYDPSIPAAPLSKPVVTQPAGAAPQPANPAQTYINNVLGGTQQGSTAAPPSADFSSLLSLLSLFGSNPMQQQQTATNPLQSLLALFGGGLPDQFTYTGSRYNNLFY